MGKNNRDKNRKPQRSKGKKAFDKDKETLEEMEKFGIKPSSRQRARTRPDYSKIHEEEER